MDVCSLEGFDFVIAYERQEQQRISCASKSSRPTASLAGPLTKIHFHTETTKLPGHKTRLKQTYIRQKNLLNRCRKKKRIRRTQREGNFKNLPIHHVAQTVLEKKRYWENDTSEPQQHMRHATTSSAFFSKYLAMKNNNTTLSFTRDCRA